MTVKLSVVVATYNEEENIGECLNSIKNIADEIIIVDAKSSDKTTTIAKSLGAKIISAENHKIFHINKQIGLDNAKGEWILQLDADEVVPDALARQILIVRNGKKPVFESDNKKLLIKHQALVEQRDGRIGLDGEIVAYFIPRLNYFLKGFLHHGGAYPDGVIRLVKKGCARFPCKSVHEQLEVYGNVGWLTEDLLHYSDRTLQKYLIKANRYTDLTVDELQKSNIRISFFNTLLYSFFLPTKTFTNIFFIKAGFKDGILGFLWAVFSSMHHFLAYSKLFNKTK